MEYNKKVGIILMVVSVVVAILSFLISDCDYCNFSEASLLALVMYGFRLRLISYETAYPPYMIDISTKYVLLFCLATFAVGMLFYLGALNAPRLKKSEQATRQSDK